MSVNRKILFCAVLFLGVITSGNLKAQYCGNSGPGVCTPTGTLTKPGFSPDPECLPPLIKGSDINLIIRFKNFDTFHFSGQVVTLQSLSFDTITNLPAGLCWATNKTNNTLTRSEEGCIKISGTVNGLAGQYKLYMPVSANIGVSIGDEGHGTYFLRVIEPGDTCPHNLDDTQTDANPFIAYIPGVCPGTGKSCAQLAAGLDDLTGNISNLGIAPNPLIDKSNVTFTSIKQAVVTEHIFNMLGSMVHSRQLELNPGNNTFNLDRGNLPPGIYIYSLSDGQSTFSKRLVIAE